MVPIVLPEDIRLLDSWCHGQMDVHPWSLMLRASRNVTDALCQELDTRGNVQTVLFAVGPGNNGGDGLCVARILHDDRPGLRILVTEVASEGLTSDLRQRAMSEMPSDIQRITLPAVVDAGFIDVVVDAITGIGGTELLRDPIPETLRALADLHAYRIALDVPTGLNTATGSAHHDTFQADVTITISAEKRGFWLLDGPTYVGRIVTVPVGVEGAEQRLSSRLTRLTHEDQHMLLPPRRRSMSKFDAGRVVVIGGTVSMPGAPSMSAEAALRVGAGLVHIAAPRIHPHTPRECIVHELAMHDDGSISTLEAPLLESLIERADVVAIGPGIGTNEATLQMLAAIIESMEPQKPIILDADGLRVLPYVSHLRPTMVLTPHRGEFARMVTVDRSRLSDNPIELAFEWCQHHPAVLHLKDTPSVTCMRDAARITVNGTPRMGTAGSGDVLTGIIAGILAQGVNIFDGVSLAAYLHAQSGVHASGGIRDQPIIATDMLRSLPNVMAYSPSS